MKALPKTQSTLLEWDSRGYNIILTTGRKESAREVTEKQLSTAGIIYDQLVMGIGGGDRVLINDRKPDGKNAARAIRIDRNEGLSQISVEDLESLALNYFKIFSNKDLKGLEAVLSDDVILRDWELSALGKQEVLAANENIFNAFDSIDVSIEKMYVSDMTVISEITIKADSETILVTDIIEFDSCMQIKSVIAYKGN
jgi:hypothetical protein